MGLVLCLTNPEAIVHVADGWILGNTGWTAKGYQAHIILRKSISRASTSMYTIFRSDSSCESVADPHPAGLLSHKPFTWTFSAS